ncbi:glycosyltransferase [Babesia caballi]|uniref:Glycosyltransferase n=1 Tax=Babesia caballi TaxID=5871 RepID=A0AAV4LXR8_BABCB|nr:glycosyltransferase [Babesia caballi]
MSRLCGRLWRAGSDAQLLLPGVCALNLLQQLGRSRARVALGLAGADEDEVDGRQLWLLENAAKLLELQLHLVVVDQDSAPRVRHRQKVFTGRRFATQRWRGVRCAPGAAAPLNRRRQQLQ